MAINFPWKGTGKEVEPAGQIQSIYFLMLSGEVCSETQVFQGKDICNWNIPSAFFWFYFSAKGLGSDTLSLEKVFPILVQNML